MRTSMNNVNSLHTLCLLEDLCRCHCYCIMVALFMPNECVVLIYSDVCRLENSEGCEPFFINRTLEINGQCVQSICVFDAGWRKGMEYGCRLFDIGKLGNLTFKSLAFTGGYARVCTNPSHVFCVS